jgi:alpha-ketoglutarate-dependent taurine dioxygenase
MAYQTIEVTKLTPHIGAEIGGVDLSRPLGNQQFQEVHDALMENLAIFFRDQNLTHDQHKDFGRRLAISWRIPHRATRPRGTRKSSPSMPTRTRSMSPARNGIPTCRATKPLRWAASSI